MTLYSDFCYTFQTQNFTFLQIKTHENDAARFPYFMGVISFWSVISFFFHNLIVIRISKAYWHNTLWKIINKKDKKIKLQVQILVGLHFAQQVHLRQMIQF